MRFDLLSPVSLSSLYTLALPFFSPNPGSVTTHASPCTSSVLPAGRATHYPHAVGHDDQMAEPMSIEECGNLLILAAAYTLVTGNTRGAPKYLEIIPKYADYLVDNRIDIVCQLSSKDAAGALANETNLAIKAAVGLKAFGEMGGNSLCSYVSDGPADPFFHWGSGTDEDQTHFVLEYPGRPDTWKTP
ncbi:hypothetical protein N7457_005275 [Penicillium paradoxum]|uniref:uncharacterized protein n=1 Tax=Penicillium paradoxum TaxID=176176 RepID=UPI00254658EE|nr:uncharacterized protein N7457_005275 [Penicillium paradoxum]KAJ5780115.1 hypothetical protein N7457_005275 [Penicillium paradoxum]